MATVVHTAITTVNAATSIATVITTMSIALEKSFHDERSSHNKNYGCHNNQPKKAGYEEERRSSSKGPCPIQSFPDKPAQHSWAECLENPANKKKPTLQRVLDNHHNTIKNHYLSNDDRSRMDSSSTYGSR
jgi:hypothetical protein